MTGSILLGIFIIILVLAAVLVVRTCSRQPTPAMTASVELDKGPRAREPAAGSMNPLAAILTGKENSGGAAPWTPRAACTVFSVRWRS